MIFQANKVPRQEHSGTVPTGTLSTVLLFGVLWAGGLFGVENEPQLGKNEGRISEVTWLLADARSAQAVVMLVHGLNLTPQRLHSLGRALQGEGFDVLMPALSGHQRGMDDVQRMKAMQTVSAKQWLEELSKAYHMARQRANAQGVPVHLVGYSLGALVALEIEQQSGLKFTRKVLIAPAIFLTWPTGLIRPLQGWPSLVLPSLSPHYYRANSGTSMAAYGALFALQADLIGAWNRSEGNGEPLSGGVVFLDPEDEFIDFNATKEAFLSKTPVTWTMCPLQKSEGAATGIHHLMIDEQTLGHTAWHRLLTNMTGYLVRGEMPRCEVNEKEGLRD